MDTFGEFGFSRVSLLIGVGVNHAQVLGGSFVYDSPLLLIRRDEVVVGEYDAASIQFRLIRCFEALHSL